MWRASKNVSVRFTGAFPCWENGSRILSGCQAYSSQPQTGTSSPAQAGAPPPQAASASAQASTPPPPPPPPKKGGLFFKLLGLTLVGGGGVVGYAWYDKDFKTKVEDTIPYSKQGLDAIFKYLPTGAEPASPPKRPTSLAIDPEEAKKVSLLRKKEKTPAAIEEAPKPVEKEDLKPAKAEIAAKKKEDEKRKKEEEKKRKEEEKQKIKEEAERKLREQELEEAAENAALENILEVAVSDAERDVKTAIALQGASADATRDHTSKLRAAMDLQGEDKENQWEAATAAFTAKADTLAEAEAASEFARLEIEKVRAAISEGKASKVTKKNPAISATEQKVNSLSYNLKTATNQNAKAQSEARVMAEYRNLVKKGKEQFKKEVESLTPDVLLQKKGGKMTEEELNNLIAHAHRRIDQLQRQLAEQQALEQLRIEAALDRQRQEDEKIADGRVDLEKERQKADLIVAKDKWDMEARIAFERELRQQLSRQAAAHSDHLSEVLKVQENELKAKFEVLLDEHLTTERQKFQAEVAGWIARLKGIETAVEGRAELEQQGRKAQELWLACQMLHNLIEYGPDTPDDIDPDDYDKYEIRMRPLLDEFMAVLDAGDNHPFVNSVLETLPDEAVKRGVWTEKELTERFYRVRKVCRRVAMLDETGGTLFQYFLSYFQSLFVFSTAKPILEHDKVDVSELNTFSILDNARYHIEHGDLETALRFMNQLNGEARNVAYDWIEEARLLLETRQAADALLAHASSRGLGSLF